MRPSPSKYLDRAGLAAALGFAVATVTPARAEAQACCAGASAIGTARLAAHEDAVIGFGARAAWLHGSMSNDRHYVGSPASTTELDFEQTFAATYRVLKHGQLTALVPIVETYRKFPDLSDAGGGLGDIQLGARYDFIEPGSSPTWPGIALSGSLTLPTGRAVEATSSPAAADATGTGSVQTGAQLALERSFGDVFVLASGGAVWRSPRVDGHGQSGDVDWWRDVGLTALAATGYSFSSGLVAAVTVGYTAHFLGSGSELTRLGLAGGYALSDDWRVQGSLFGDVPLEPLARNQPLGVGFSLMLLRSSW